MSKLHIFEVKERDYFDTGTALMRNKSNCIVSNFSRNVS
jgi:hypothetical protein